VPRFYLSIQGKSCDVSNVTDVYYGLLVIRVEQLHFFFVLAEILQEQKWIIAVLFMVPVYASESVSISCICSDSLLVVILLILGLHSIANYVEEIFIASEQNVNSQMEFFANLLQAVWV
jgi:hypothetical protein